MSLARLDEARLIEFAKTVELTASKFLEGFHSTVRGGEGLEFHSYLPYAEGEDSRRIDWRRWAQSDRLFVKKFEKEEKLSWSILVDGSASMQFESKSDAVNLWAAVISYLARLWSDSCFVYPNIRENLNETYRALLSGEAKVLSDEFPSIEPQSRSKLIVLSDFFFDLDRFEKSMTYWRQEFHSIHLIQVLDRGEREFDWGEVIEFEDFESSDKLLLDSAVAKKSYKAELQALQARLQAMVKDSGTYHCFQAEPQQMTQQLFEFFEKQ